MRHGRHDQRRDLVTVGVSEASNASQARTIAEGTPPRVECMVAHRRDTGQSQRVQVTRQQRQIARQTAGVGFCMERVCIQLHTPTCRGGAPDPGSAPQSKLVATWSSPPRSAITIISPLQGSTSGAVQLIRATYQEWS